MRKIVFFLLSMGILAFVVSAEAQPPEGKGKKGLGGKGQGKGKFEIGTVIPPHVRGSLELTEEQQKQIAELEKEVRKQLEKILTEEQRRKFESSGPPGGEFGPPDKKDFPPGKKKDDFSRAIKPNTGIAWFATLEPALAEAKRTGKPILYLSAAPHCGGISGIW